MIEMLTKSKRRRLLVMVVAALAVLGGGVVVNHTADDALRARTTDLQRRLDRAYRPTRLRDVSALDHQAWLGAPPAQKALAVFLDRSGTTADFFAGEGATYRARFSVEAWGRRAVYEVLWSDGSTTVRRVS